MTADEEARRAIGRALMEAFAARGDLPDDIAAPLRQLLAADLPDAPTPSQPAPARPGRWRKRSN